MRISVLVTAVGCPGGVSIVQALREDPRLRIVGCDMRADVACAALVDAFYVVPGGRDSEYISVIEEIVRREDVRVILPLATYELVALSAAVARLSKIGCRICVSDADAVETCVDKSRLYDRKRDSPHIPRYRLVRTWDDLLAAAKSLGFPQRKVVIRLPVSHGSIGLRILDSSFDAYAAYKTDKPSNVFVDFTMFKYLFHRKEIEPVLVTEYVPGTEYGVDLLMDPHSHDVISGIVRENGAVRLSSVDNGSIVGRLDVMDVAADLCRSIGLSYAVNVDMRLDETGTPKVLEVNPRLPATSFLSTVAGLNLPLLSVHLAMGKKIDLQKTNDSAHVRSYRGFVVVDASNRLLGRA